MHLLASDIWSEVAEWLRLGVLGAIVWTVFQFFLKRESRREDERLTQTKQLIATLVKAVESFERSELEEQRIHTVIQNRLEKLENGNARIVDTLERISTTQTQTVELLRRLMEKSDRAA